MSATVQVETQTSELKAGIPLDIYQFKYGTVTNPLVHYLEAEMWTVAADIFL